MVKFFFTFLALLSATVCPPDMVNMDGRFCIDRYEAPNVEGKKPLIMMSQNDCDKWCGLRGKRICYDDEWEFACVEKPTCNNRKVWRKYQPKELRKWPSKASSPKITSLEEQFEIAKNKHVEWLYQGEPAGSTCSSFYGVHDMLGNAEEWTKRRNRGKYSGAIKGRFWAEKWTCKMSVTSHAEAFRFYETGCRCCKDSGETIKILPIGDSITVGVGDMSNGGYRGYLQDKMLKPFDMIGPNQQGRGDKDHAGFGGRTVRWLEPRIDKLLEKNKADVIIFMMGINDLRQSKPDEIAVITESILRRFKTQKVILLGLTLCPLRAEKVARYNSRLELIARRMKREGYNIVYEQPVITKEDLKDSVHPNRSGYKKIAQTIYDNM